MDLLSQDLITVKQLQKRWKKKTPEAIWKLARRYDEILKPMKIGKELRFHPDNVKKFEENMRVKR